MPKAKSKPEVAKQIKRKNYEPQQHSRQDDMDKFRAIPSLVTGGKPSDAK